MDFPLHRGCHEGRQGQGCQSCQSRPAGRARRGASRPALVRVQGLEDRAAHAHRDVPGAMRALLGACRWRRQGARRRAHQVSRVREQAARRGRDRRGRGQRRRRRRWPRGGRPHDRPRGAASFRRGAAGRDGPAVRDHAGAGRGAGGHAVAGSRRLAGPDGHARQHRRAPRGVEHGFAGRGGRCDGID